MIVKKFYNKVINEKYSNYDYINESIEGAEDFNEEIEDDEDEDFELVDVILRDYYTPYVKTHVMMYSEDEGIYENDEHVKYDINDPKAIEDIIFAVAKQNRTIGDGTLMDCWDEIVSGIKNIISKLN